MRIDIPISGPGDLITDACPPGGCPNPDQNGSSSQTNTSTGTSTTNTVQSLAAFTNPGLNVYYFSSVNCPNCTDIKTDIDSLRAALPFNIIDVSTDNNRGLDFAAAAGVNAIPSIVLADGDQIIEVYRGANQIVPGANSIVDFVSDRSGSVAEDSTAVQPTGMNNFLSNINFKDPKIWAAGIALLALLNKK